MRGWWTAFGLENTRHNRRRVDESYARQEKVVKPVINPTSRNVKNAVISVIC